MKWEQITVEQYQCVYEIMKRSDIDDVELCSLIISALYRVTQEEIDNWPIDKFNKACQEVTNLLNSEIPGKPVNFIKANGRWYKPQYMVTKMTFGQYAEVKTFGAEIVENCNKIMASVCKHVKVFGKSKLSHEERANDFLQARFIDVYHAALFFWAVYRNLMVDIKDYMLPEMKEKMSIQEAEEAWQNLIKGLDGFTMPNLSAN